MNVIHEKMDTIRFHLHEMPRVVKFIKSKLNGGWLWGGGNNDLFNEYSIKVQFCKMKKS